MAQAPGARPAQHGVPASAARPIPGRAELKGGADNERSLAETVTALSAAERECLEAAASGRLMRVRNGWSRPGEARAFRLDTARGLIAAGLVRIDHSQRFPRLALTFNGRMALAMMEGRHNG